LPSSGFGGSSSEHGSPEIASYHSDGVTGVDHFSHRQAFDQFHGSGSRQWRPSYRGVSQVERGVASEAEHGFGKVLAGLGLGSLGVAGAAAVTRRKSKN
jgi:hypothetical protein